MSVKLAGACEAPIPAEVPIYSAHQLVLSKYAKIKISISGYAAIYYIDYPRLYKPPANFTLREHKKP